jgi:hypothetical protein
MPTLPGRLYRRLRFGDPVIVVSGLPRSGTSMMMNMLQAGGLTLFADNVRIADDSNPLGYFEFERVKTLETDPDRSWVRGARGQAIKIVCPLLRFLPETNNYRVVFMERDLVEVIASQDTMLEKAGEPPGGVPQDEVAKAYEHQLWRAKYLVSHRPCFEALFVRHRDVLADPAGQARRVATFLGRVLDVDRMAGAVDERLYRNRQAEGSGRGEPGLRPGVTLSGRM